MTGSLRQLLERGRFDLHTNTATPSHRPPPPPATCPSPRHTASPAATSSTAPSTPHKSTSSACLSRAPQPTLTQSPACPAGPATASERERERDSVAALLMHTGCLPRGESHSKGAAECHGQEEGAPVMKAQPVHHDAARGEACWQAPAGLPGAKTLQDKRQEQHERQHPRGPMPTSHAPRTAGRRLFAKGASSSSSSSSSSMNKGCSNAHQHPSSTAAPPHLPHDSTHGCKRARAADTGGGLRGAARQCDNAGQRGDAATRYDHAALAPASPRHPVPQIQSGYRKRLGTGGGVRGGWARVGVGTGACCGGGELPMPRPAASNGSAHKTSAGPSAGERCRPGIMDL